MELEKMENECLQRTNDNHDMMKRVSLQNETLSTTFKVKHNELSNIKIILISI